MKRNQDIVEQNEVHMHLLCMTHEPPVKQRRQFLIVHERVAHIQELLRNVCLI